MKLDFASHDCKYKVELCNKIHAYTGITKFFYISNLLVKYNFAYIIILIYLLNAILYI